MTHEQILTELNEGNQRFINNTPKQRTHRPKDFEAGQAPKTIVITCADSRVPPELLFDQDLGDLFVIRVAGNTATNEAIGSAEYAAANLGSQVLLVLGHTNCGAVGAAIDHVQNGTALPTSCLQTVVDPIVQPVKDSLGNNSDDVLNTSIDLNVKKSLSDILEKSPIIKDLNSKGTLVLRGAKYDLATGEVKYLD